MIAIAAFVSVLFKPNAAEELIVSERLICYLIRIADAENHLAAIADDAMGVNNLAELMLVCERARGMSA